MPQDRRTIMACLDRTAERFPNRPALQQKIKGSWTAITWSEYRKQIRQAAKAMIHLGLEAGDGVSLIGFNCPEWAIGDLAAIWAGGIPAGIYTTNAPEQCEYIASHSESSIAVVDDAEQLAKFKEIRPNLPKLKAIVMMHGDDADDAVYSWQDFLKLGDEVDNATLEERIAAQSPDDVCTLIYTSGTTGDPKAVMITHDNLTWTANVALTTVGGDSKDRILSYLPFSHIAEQAVALHGPIHMGSCTYFAESMDALGDNLKEVRPTLFLGVPRVWEKIQAKMQATAKGNSPLKTKLVKWAKTQGLAGGYAMQKGK
jgi:long-subunit acyl-CoA synthetase (AMP-forming)